jgi:thiol-disulfide isomerase/thioredoxin
MTRGLSHSSRRFLLVSMICVALSLMATSIARAQVSVGQPVDFKLQTLDGKTLGTKDLKGKIVILDFWATWCPPCREEVPHMVKTNEEYASKGLQIIGVSLDQSIGDMKPFISQNKMSWLHSFDGKRTLSKQFGVDSIPRVFLFSPDGVLRWTGHPARLDKELKDVFEKYPPQLVDAKVLETAKGILDDATKKADAGDTKAALRIMAKLPPEASQDKAFAESANGLRGKLDAAAQEMLAAADKDIEAGKFVPAAERLRDLSLSLGNLPIGIEAKKKLTALMSKPEVKQAVEAAQREAHASVAVGEAEKLRAAKKHEQAYPMFRQLAKAWVGTPSGDKAAAVVKEYESDAAFMKGLNAKEAGGRAKAALSMARGYAGSGRTDAAIKKYQSIITDYPNTDWAKTAETEMAKLK